MLAIIVIGICSLNIERPAVITPFGCKLNQVEGKHIYPGWQVYGWIKDKETLHLISIREPDEVEKAMDDCVKFLKCMRKENAHSNSKR